MQSQQSVKKMATRLEAWVTSRRLGLILSTFPFLFPSVTNAVQRPLQIGECQLPPAQTYPLPPSLAQWQDTEQRGDYFDQVQPTPWGYLIWLQFPIRVYIQAPEGPASTASFQRTQAWFEAIQHALHDWKPYLPLVLTETPEMADIRVWRSQPPIQRRPDGQLERIRAAETRYEFYLQPTGGTPRLAHRFQIFLTPNQSAAHTLATARHELGHALGIWGHSLQATDALYFSQVRQSPSISPRDINTLKRVYEHPTQLGQPCGITSDLPGH
jgi:predicted Zn-dependent protease